MGRVKKSKAASRRNGQKGAEALRVTDEERQVHTSAPKLTLTAPKTFTVDRGPTPRKMKSLEKRSWKFVVAHFHEAPVKEAVGAYDDPESDYGGLKSIMKMEAGNKVGFVFMGTPSCKKPGQTKNFVPMTHRPYAPLIRKAAELGSNSRRCLG
jgi:hypothetical protein